MMTTIVVQHQHSMPSTRSDTHHSRDSNSTSAPLPTIPRRASRSHSIPSCSSTPQSSVSTCHRWGQGADDSDSSSGSEGLRSFTKPRRRKVRGFRSGALSPPQVNLPLSPTKNHTNPSPHPCQPQAKQGVTTAKSEDNAPAIAAPRPRMHVPGMLRLSIETIRSHLTDPHSLNARNIPDNGYKSAPPGGSEGPRLIRNKSGQPVKPSLKSSRSATRGNLSVATFGSSSKSEPATPTHKAVHFDTKLEHVKLFLAEQKPLAVSRDGSPTEDTSGTDSDFPSFIYGSDEEQRPRKKLIMRPINMPTRPKLDADVALEDFYLNFDGTNILGKVRVRNLAYAKSVAIRFTFDSWQTTSEVIGRYSESINPQFDRFSFNIRLNDLLARIEGKTFIMAIRYNADGQEAWDNNNHQNYVATFTKTKIALESRRSDDEDASDVEILRNRLEQVILQGKGNSNALRSGLKKRSTVRSNETDPPCLKSSVSLASRYDFTTSLRNSGTWKPSNSSIYPVFPPQSHSRSLSYPQQHDKNLASPSLPQSSIPWPEKGSPNRLSSFPMMSFKNQPLLGSPRDVDGDQLFSASRIPFVKLSDNASCITSPLSARHRNHRRGFVDIGTMDTNGSVKRTPPGSPSSELPELILPPDSPLSPLVSPVCLSSRYHSFPPLAASGSLLSSSLSDSFEPEHASAVDEDSNMLSPPTFLRDLQHDIGSGSGESSAESELSTPSPATPTTSRSATPSPTDPFMKAMLPPVYGNDSSLEMGLGLIHGIDNLQSVSPGTHYRQFLNKFCFFTGTSAGRDNVDITMSTARDSSTRWPPANGGHDPTSGEPPHQAIGRSKERSLRINTLKSNESVDNLTTARDDSGASTPTMASGKWGSRPETPVPS